jgi:hypothetical protein
MSNFSPHKCHRCGTETIMWTMSRFNTQECCIDCIEEEKKHHRYPEAERAELEAIKNGDYNFPGIGLPDDLR